MRYAMKTSLSPLVIETLYLYKDIWVIRKNNLEL